MIKFVSPSGWDFDGPCTRLIKWAGDTMGTNDRREFLKTASADLVAQMGHIKLSRDEVPVHLIALGALEAYGPNRNGDGFSAQMCRDHHQSFVKLAQYYTNHRNKPSQGHPHFGKVKAAAYNDAMKRVELLVTLYRTKAAAERMGGFVDEDGLQKLATTGEFPVSMACRVPYDVCSFCGNEARTRDEYCTREKCAAGGCADNLSRLVKLASGDMHHLHVRNPTPAWFDISRVWRNADHIALGANADWFQKAASAGGMFEMDALIHLAKQASCPLDVIVHQSELLPPVLAAQVKLACALTTLERTRQYENISLSAPFDAGVQGSFDVSVLGEPGTTKCAEGLGALADQKIVLPLRDFAKLVKAEDNVAAASSRLPGVYERMIDDNSLERRIESNRFGVSEKLASHTQRAAAERAAPQFSLESSHVVQRGQLAALRGCEPALLPTKTASDSAGAEQLARDYAVYKLAALQRIASFDRDFHLTGIFSVRQNRVI
jgi:hypothetical protein